jgi:hypothetical protein
MVSKKISVRVKRSRRFEVISIDEHGIWVMCGLIDVYLLNDVALTELNDFKP